MIYLIILRNLLQMFVGHFLHPDGQRVDPHRLPGGENIPPVPDGHQLHGDAAGAGRPARHHRLQDEATLLRKTHDPWKTI